MLSKFFKPSIPAIPEHPTKKFPDELNKFNQMILSGEPFALSRFGDGEMIVIHGQAIDLSKKYHGEHKYQPHSSKDEKQRAILTEALHYQAENYFVAIACPCCVGMEKFQKLKQQASQQESQLTWANIFVNSNYTTFRSATIGAIKKREPVLFVGHSNGDTNGLPFSVEKHYKVGPNAWTNDFDRLLNELTTDLSLEKNNRTILFCAGVLSNLLIYKLTQALPQHTYIDCGSVFDVDLGLGKTRKYLKKGKTLNRTCVWV